MRHGFAQSHGVSFKGPACRYRLCQWLQRRERPRHPPAAPTRSQPDLSKIPSERINSLRVHAAADGASPPSCQAPIGASAVGSACIDTQTQCFRGYRPAYSSPADGRYPAILHAKDATAPRRKCNQKGVSISKGGQRCSFRKGSRRSRSNAATISRFCFSLSFFHAKNRAMALLPSKKAR